VSEQFLNGTSAHNINLELGAHCLHMVQLMPLPSQNPIVSSSFKSRVVLLFRYWLTQVVLVKWLLHEQQQFQTVGAISLVDSSIASVVSEYSVHSCGSGKLTACDTGS